MDRDEAVLKVRSDPEWSTNVRLAYFDEDVEAAAKRFLASGEFLEICTLLDSSLPGARILDIGSGNGIASYAFAKAGAETVYALEPNPSKIVGRGAMEPLIKDLPIHPLEGFGESIELGDASVRVAYCRAVLHHVADLEQFMRECFRVLEPGGKFLATREHVVDNDEQLQEFLRRHPLNHLTHDENAYRLEQYQSAIQAAGFELNQVLGPWDCVINAYPAANSQQELEAYPARLLASRLGLAGRILGKSPQVRRAVHRHISRPLPGRLYSFLATKPMNHA